MKTTRILLIMALILSVAAQAEAKKVKLLYQLKAGDQFKYELTINQDIAQEVMGQSQATTVNTSNTYSFNVVEVTAAGDYLINVSLVATSMATTSPMGEMKYNSVTDTVVPDYAKNTAVLLNQVYSFKMDKLGVISDVKAPEGIVEKVNKIIEEMSGGQGQMVAGAAGMAASAEGFRNTLEGQFMVFPDGGAATNDPWEVKSKINQIIMFDTKTKFELVKSSKEENEIKITSQITQDPTTPPMEMQGMTINYELIGSRDGKMLIDAVTGLLNSTEAVTTISGTISIDSPQMPSPMSIPMTIRMVEKTTKK
jgi:hypothetical protein